MTVGRCWPLPVPPVPQHLGSDWPGRLDYCQKAVAAVGVALPVPGNRARIPSTRGCAGVVSGDS